MLTTSEKVDTHDMQHNLTQNLLQGRRGEVVSGDAAEKTSQGSHLNMNTSTTGWNERDEQRRSNQRQPATGTVMQQTLPGEHQ